MRWSVKPDLMRYSSGSMLQAPLQRNSLTLAIAAPRTKLSTREESAPYAGKWGPVGFQLPYSFI
jgi:hypothetical protein